MPTVADDLMLTGPEPETSTLTPLIVTSPLLESLDDCPELRVVGAFVIVSQPFFGVAAGACDREIVEIISAPVVPRNDVLDRCHQAASQAKAEIVVRITGDCPVIDPVLIDDCVNTLLDGSFDFTCNRLPPPFTRTYPIGLDTEVCTFAALEKAWNDAKETFHREHVMPFIYEGVSLVTENRSLSTGISKRGFKIAQLHHDPDYGRMRWTVDTPEDLEFMRQVYSRFDGRDDFTWQEVLALVQREPELAAINSTVRHKTLYDK